MRWLLVVLATMLSVTGLSVSGSARADEPAIAKELDAVASWLASKKVEKCLPDRDAHCMVLTKLKLGGATDGAVTFTLEGAVLAGHAVAVPLFGPPNKVRIEDVKEDGKPAPVGFEGDHYFVMSEGKRFTVTGKLFLDGDLALSIPGPLNTLEADLEKGRVVEGARLSGLSAATIHFEHAAAQGEPAAKTEPTVFQLSRAIRVLRETAFEYKLTLRSGSELGVVRLPLSLGEKVLDVNGATGWKIDGADLVLPTAGHQATIVVTGTMAEAPKHMTPDPRSSYEWWLLESDGEHRLEAGKTPGSAKQLDVAESPIARTQPNSRLFLAHRGESLDLTVQTLASIEALAAVIRDHARTLVLTPRGDWVIDESLTYENNGVDYLVHAPGARPIFLATDGVAERIMHKEGDANALMIALRKGQHVTRVQSVASSKFAPLFGVLSPPIADQPLTASRATVHLGLPSGVHPLALFGCDKPQLFASEELLVVAGLALLAALVFGERLRDRALIVVALLGAWFVSSPLYVAAIVALTAVALGRVLPRVVTGDSLKWSRVALLGFAGLVAVIVMASANNKASAPPYRAQDIPVASTEVRSPDKTESTTGKNEQAGDGTKAGELGNYAANNGGWVLPGVTPVALPLPSADRWVTASRELVTKERPFQPRLVYVTTLGLSPFVAAWIASLAALAFVHRAKLAALVAALRKLLAPKEEPPAPAVAAADAE